jgi:hypothetical protein
VTVARVHWEDQPGDTWQAVEQHTGTVLSAVTVSAGLNSAVAAVLSTATGWLGAASLPPSLDAVVHRHGHGWGAG